MRVKGRVGCGTAVTALWPASAQASFNSWGHESFCRGDPLCLFVGVWIAGAVLVPVSLLVYWGLSWIFGRHDTSRKTRTWWVLFNATAAYLVAAIYAALGTKREIDPTAVYAYVAYTVAAVLYLRRLAARSDQDQDAEDGHT